MLLFVFFVFFVVHCLALPSHRGWPHPIGLPTQSGGGTCIVLPPAESLLTLILGSSLAAYFLGWGALPPVSISTSWSF